MHSHQIHDLLLNDLLTGIATHTHNEHETPFWLGHQKQTNTNHLPRRFRGGAVLTQNNLVRVVGV